MSRLHSISSEIISILDKDGSSGNSTIFRPNFVNWPVLSKAPSIHNWYMELSKLSSGGGSMKWNCKRFSTPRDLSRSTTLDKLVR